jgi:hypothetical protein
MKRAAAYVGAGVCFVGAVVLVATLGDVVLGLAAALVGISFVLTGMRS